MKLDFKIIEDIFTNPEIASKETDICKILRNAGAIEIEDQNNSLMVRFDKWPEHELCTTNKELYKLGLYQTGIRYYSGNIECTDSGLCNKPANMKYLVVWYSKRY